MKAFAKIRRLQRRRYSKMRPPTGFLITAACDRLRCLAYPIALPIAFRQPRVQGNEIAET